MGNNAVYSEQTENIKTTEIEKTTSWSNTLREHLPSSILLTRPPSNTDKKSHLLSPPYFFCSSSSPSHPTPLFDFSSHSLPLDTQGWGINHVLPNVTLSYLQEVQFQPLSFSMVFPQCLFLSLRLSHHSTFHSSFLFRHTGNLSSYSTTSPLLQPASLLLSRPALH